MTVDGESVPNHWRRTTFGRFARVLNGADYSSVEVESGGYPVYGSGGEFRRASEYLFNGESVLFGRKGTVDRPLYVDGRFWTVDTMFYTRIDERSLLPRFAYYWATTLPFGAWATDTALPSMTSTAIKAAPIAVPPVAEQRAIVDFLDRETAQIDAFIVKNEELITLLTERRVAVINAPFAAHSTNARLAHACEAVVDCPHTTPDVDDDGVFEAVRTASVRDGRFVHGQGLAVSEGTWRARNGRNGPREGDVLFTREAPAGEACMVPSTDVCLGQRMVLLRIDSSKADGEFLMWQLYSREVQQYFELAANGSTVTNIRLPLLRATPIWLPDLGVQRAVRRDLVDSLRLIEEAIEVARRSIGLARERRAALISAAVTGKISVGVDA